MVVNNRIVEPEDLTFFQWLNIYEKMTKREFRQLSEDEQAQYRAEYKSFKKE